MSRKHENFKYSYGWKTAPEQWRFYWNGNPIQLDNETRSTVAQLMLAGKEDEAEAILKRLLRKQEKETSFICIGFLTKNGNRYYFTQDLKCRRDNLEDKLNAYKKLKRYIEDNNGRLLTAHKVTSGYLSPDGKMVKENEMDSQEEIDLTRPIIVRLIKTPEMKIFQM